MMLIKTTDDVDELLMKSKEQPVLFFKHSTNNELSATAHKEFVEFSKHPHCALLAQVNVIEDRPVSTYIAEELKVEHEPPQVILVHRGMVVWRASGKDITAEALNAAVSVHCT